MEEQNYSAQDQNPDSTNQQSYDAPSSGEAAVPAHDEDTPKRVGPTVGIAVIIIVLILGGLYVWGSQLNKQAMMQDSGRYAAQEPGEIASDSDEPERIEKDLESFDSEGFEVQLDADLKAMEDAL